MPSAPNSTVLAGSKKLIKSNGAREKGFLKSAELRSISPHKSLQFVAVPGFTVKPAAVNNTSLSSLQPLKFW